MQFSDNKSTFSDFCDQGMKVSPIDELHEDKGLLIFLTVKELNVVWDVTDEIPMLQFFVQIWLLFQFFKITFSEGLCWAESNVHSIVSLDHG